MIKSMSYEGMQQLIMRDGVEVISCMKGVIDGLMRWMVCDNRRKHRIPIKDIL